MSNWMVALICWVAFSAVVMIGDYFDEIAFYKDWVYVALTAPLSVPILAIGIPVAFCIRIIKKIHFEELFDTIKYCKKRRF